MYKVTSILVYDEKDYITLTTQPRITIQTGWSFKKNCLKASEINPRKEDLRVQDLRE